MRLADLDENHRRALLSRLHRIDDLLIELESRLDPGGCGSIFRSPLTGLTPAQQQAIGQFVNKIRHRFYEYIQGQGLDAQSSPSLAAQAIRSTVSSMDMLADELRPGRMRAYGRLSADDRYALEAAADVLQDMLNEIRTCLAKLVKTP